MDIWERLRLFKQGEDSGEILGGSPRRDEDDFGVMVVAFSELSENLTGWLKRHGREGKYPIRVEEWEPGNREDIEPGIYCKTNITGDEWDQEMELRFFYGGAITGVLTQVGRLERKQIIGNITPSIYATPEGYAILRIEI